ncbi:MAG: TerC family protein [Melioribacteraceae bacterium]|jgi:tellurite resistance protein TerC|nr:TerC family protein [Melioribacteraceae bacterium]
MDNHFLFWVVFTVAVSIMFYIDLYATDHRHGKIGIKSSLIWSGVWILTALLFNLAIFLFLEDGKQKALEFLTAYIVEKSLSVDNLFVFLMIFSVMGIREENQPHILKWGIISAIVMRIVFILIGIELIKAFHPVIYIFGLFLLYAAYKMSFASESKVDYENNTLIKFVKKHFSVITDYHGEHFFTRKNGKLMITQLFLTFLLIETSDLIFAIDSIPAVIAISQDPFIVITSNIFAILGLRALYFALSGIAGMFYYLKYGVSIVLAYVGVKMMLVDIYKIPTIFSLSFILGCLLISVLVSLKFKNHSST